MLVEDLSRPSFCLFTKIYSHRELEDEILSKVCSPLIHELNVTGKLKYFFFLRYADPDRHVRIRFFGDRGLVQGQLRKQILDRIQTAVTEHGAIRVEQDRYRPEWNRYGGRLGVRIAERIFAASSRAVLSLLALGARPVAASRVEFAMVTVEGMLDAIGISAEDRQVFFRSLRTNLDGMAPERRDAIQSFSELLQPRLVRAAPQPRGYWSETDPELHQIQAMLYEDLAPVRVALRKLSSDLSQPMARLASSYYHMHMNRMSLSNAEELILRIARKRHAVAA